MNDKICEKCKASTKLENFPKIKRCISGFSNRCKKCIAKNNRDYRRKKDKLAILRYNQISGCFKRRNLEPHNFTRKEFIEWFNNNPKLDSLYRNWVDGGFIKDSSISIDRLDDYKPYSLNNIRLVTWKENNEKGKKDRRNGINNKHSKALIQLGENGDFIEKYPSISFASRKTGISKGNIVSTCKNVRLSAGGFKWKYDNA